MDRHSPIIPTPRAPLCVQAIWMTRAHSISPRGLAPSMNAKLAFIAISEIPLFGNSIDVHWRVRRSLHRGVDSQSVRC
jgi:hypothetical protein